MMKYCFSGFLSSPTSIESPLWQRVQKEYCKIQSSDLRANSESREEAARLNQLDSRYWLLTTIIGLLAKGNPDFSSNMEIIESTLDLQKRRRFLLQELKPLKKKYYPNLLKLQKIIHFIRNIPPVTTELERDYRVIEDILARLTRYIDVTPSSTLSSKEIIDVFKKEWESNQDSLNISSLGILYEIQRLLTWMSRPKKKPREKPLGITIDLIPKREQRIIPFEDGCEHWKALMYDLITKKPEERNKIKFFTDHDDPNLKAYKLTRCGDCDKMERRRTVIN